MLQLFLLKWFISISNGNFDLCAWSINLFLPIFIYLFVFIFRKKITIKLGVIFRKIVISITSILVLLIL